MKRERVRKMYSSVEIKGKYEGKKNDKDESRKHKRKKYYRNEKTEIEKHKKIKPIKE